jgi:triphosphoribosyl-dephospho-CoA synthase
MAAPDPDPIAPDQISQALYDSCLAELDAPKPGNVHRFAPGHGMEVSHFVDSATAIAPILVRRDLGVGERIYRAVEASWAASGCNTNLGIILLAAPLIEAAFIARRRRPFRAAVAQALNALTLADADWAFRAIARASPGGLGETESHDVRKPAAIGLVEAMALAAPRDFIARQYADGFADVLGLGLRRARWARRRWPQTPWVWALAVYLGFLSRLPDSHVLRKHGEGPLASVLATGKRLDAALKRAAAPDSVIKTMLAQDALFKAAKINPGTSADLTVASLLALRLIDMMPPGRRT